MCIHRYIQLTIIPIYECLCGIAVANIYRQTYNKILNICIVLELSSTNLPTSTAHVNGQTYNRTPIHTQKNMCLLSSAARSQSQSAILFWSKQSLINLVTTKFTFNCELRRRLKFFGTFAAQRQVSTAVIVVLSCRPGDRAACRSTISLCVKSLIVRVCIFLACAIEKVMLIN